jgi:hypothetical protein
MIQASKLGLRIMRYELTEHEWAAIRPMLPGGYQLTVSETCAGCHQAQARRIWIGGDDRKKSRNFGGKPEGIHLMIGDGT